MQPRLYIDEDAMARALVQGLRARGLDIMTVVDAGMAAQGDRAQLEYAAANRRVLYTFNIGDFCRLHAEYTAQDRRHSGIVVAYRQRYSVGEQMRRLLRLVNTKSAEEMAGNLYFL